MRIAILGTRGIPNPYGGYEQYAQFLAMGFAKNGHDVIVYNSHNNPYQKSEWNKVSIIHIQDNEFKFGSLGRFFFNLKCVKDLKKRNCDIILQLDYTTLSLWNFLIPKDSIVVTFMDSLIGKKTSHAKLMRTYLNFAEKLAAKYSDHLISDSEEVETYLTNYLNKNSTLIPYAVDLFDKPDEQILKLFDVVPYQYDLLISRVISNNELEIVLDGVVAANLNRPFLVIGNCSNLYGYSLKEKYKAYPQIRFLGSIYDSYTRDNLRFFSNLYFHPNTVSSTNALLLNAMSASCLVASRNNNFNASILGKHGFYFDNARDVSVLLKSIDKTDQEYNDLLKANHKKITEVYNWERILKLYEQVFLLLQNSKQTYSQNIEAVNR